MKIIKNILRAIRRFFKASPALAPAIAIKTPEMAKERPSGADSCRQCYVCQSGIVPTVTPSEFREATKDGRPIPDEWFTSVDQCGICVSCEKCFSGQG